MALYTKDDINFHGFLAATRKLQERTMPELGRGLYSKTMMKRIEEGERLPKKLERDRIVARLGVTGDRYEDYLSYPEYELWAARQDIVKSVEAKDWANLERQLKEYKGTTRRSRVEKQFIEAMRFMMQKANGASEEELRETIVLATSYTIPSIKRTFPEKLLLSAQEIDLIIEYVSLYIPSYIKSDEKHHMWKLNRYTDISHYIEQSCMDNIEKSKVYPKLVYYICKEYGVEKCDMVALQKCFDWCNDAIELLRKTRRLYYFVELLEIRQILAERLINEKKEDALVAVLEESKAWEKMFKELYAEYHVSAYMENSCYLYWETESHCINDVIRIRRKMLGLSQEKLSDGICSIKTIVRTELKKTKPQMYDVRGLFEKLGLCPEYVRANVITTDPEVMKLHRDVARYNNERNIISWKESLDKLENSLCMDIVQNQQAIMRERCMLDYYSKRISHEKYILGLKETIGLTLPLDSVLKMGEWYLTVAEINCIYSMVSDMDTCEESSYLEVLVEYCKAVYMKEQFSTRLGVNEMLVTGIANTLGSLGREKESNDLGNAMIRCCLRTRRMRTLARNLYSNCWNIYKVGNGDSLAREEDAVNTTLHRCILLSDIMDNDVLKKFFVKMSQD